MVNWIFWGVVIAGNLVLVPYFLYLLLISVAARLPRRQLSLPVNPVSKFLIVIPAHDEEPVIRDVVQSCLAVSYPRELFQVVVIADNCSDQTARLAAGARCAGGRAV